MKTSNKLIVLIVIILVGLVPVSAKLLRTAYEPISKKTKPINEVNVLVIKNIPDYTFQISSGDSAYIPDLNNYSIESKYNQDTMFILGNYSKRSIEQYRRFIFISLNKCPNHIIVDSSCIFIGGFKQKQNHLFLKMSGANAWIDNIQVDSTYLEQAGGQYVSFQNTAFNYLNLNVQDSSSLYLSSKKINKIDAIISPDARISSTAENMKQIFDKQKD